MCESIFFSGVEIQEFFCLPFSFNLEPQFASFLFLIPDGSTKYKKKIATKGILP